jgi:hypothetical protein
MDHVRAEGIDFLKGGHGEETAPSARAYGTIRIHSLGRPPQLLNSFSRSAATTSRAHGTIRIHSLGRPPQLLNSHAQSTIVSNAFLGWIRGGGGVVRFRHKF